MLMHAYYYHFVPIPVTYAYETATTSRLFQTNSQVHTQHLILD
jgi:hypothetical protein